MILRRVARMLTPKRPCQEDQTADKLGIQKALEVRQLRASVLSTQDDSRLVWQYKDAEHRNKLEANWRVEPQRCLSSFYV